MIVKVGRGNKIFRARNSKIEGKEKQRNIPHKKI